MKDLRRAILIDKKPIYEPDLKKWAAWFEDSSSRRVAEDFIGEICISTVFLGIDHGWGEIPLWFETMIFGGPLEGFQRRYETWEQAEVGHIEAVRLARGEPI